SSDLGNSTLKVFVNGTQYGGDISVTSETPANFSVDVNIEGDVTIELVNSGNRIAVDNLNWTCFEIAPCETPLPTAEAQEFCEGATVADLVAEGTEIKWYDAEDATMPLTEDTVLVAGTYYATQTIDGCESEKLAVEVTLTTAPIIITQPTDQTLSIGETATFSVEAEDAAEFQWSLSADDGITWTEIDGETAFTYTTEPVTEEMN